MCPQITVATVNVSPCLKNKLGPQWTFLKLSESYIQVTSQFQGTTNEPLPLNTQLSPSKGLQGPQTRLHTTINMSFTVPRGFSARLRAVKLAQVVERKVLDLKLHGSLCKQPAGASTNHNQSRGHVSE